MDGVNPQARRTIRPLVWRERQEHGLEVIDSHAERKAFAVLERLRRAGTLFCNRAKPRAVD
jgi:hypothetical protein